MTLFDEKLINNYINGEDIEGVTLEELENNIIFMEKVISKTNDYRMYNHCSDKVKTDPRFIRFLMKRFMNNLDFLCTVADFYFEKNENDVDTIEIAIIMRAILKSKNDDRYLKYELIRNVLYVSLRLQVETVKRIEKEDYEFQYDTGLGFWYIFDLYKNNEIVVNFYAKKMLHELFIDDYYSLDKILHNQYSSIEEMEDKGVYNVLINVITVYDNMLAAYVAVHKDLLKIVIKKYYTVLKRWDSFVDIEEANRYEKIYEEVNDYMDGRESGSVLSAGDLLSFAGLQLGVEDKFVQYQLIDSIELDMIKEEEQNCIDTLNSSLIDRINYQNVKKIIKSILFPNQVKAEEPKKEGKILVLDNYRKKEKTRQI